MPGTSGGSGSVSFPVGGANTGGGGSLAQSSASLTAGGAAVTLTGALLGLFALRRNRRDDPSAPEGAGQ
jgi:hypothetical protein